MGAHTSYRSPTCSTSVCVLRIFLILANDSLLYSSLEYGVRLCDEQEPTYRLSLPGGTRWFSPPCHRWRRHWRSIRCRSSGTGDCYLLTRPSPRAFHRTCRRCLDRGEINLALGGASLLYKTTSTIFLTSMIVLVNIHRRCCYSRIWHTLPQRK